MPFGDSITDYGCWRALVWEMFQQSGHDVEFVGSRTSETACGGLVYDRDHEGHPGYAAAGIASQNQLVDWLRQNPADIITMHLGTNDILQRRGPTSAILEAFSTMVGQMRDSNPSMMIIVAQIIPLPQYAAAVDELNASIPAWAASVNSTRSPVYVVDQWTGLDPSTDLYDGVHLTESGELKVADRFYSALVQAIHSIGKE
ncbi:related to acetylxylan esterase [Cephalotrichum gorgonifer]|uniref:Related to acetylxylan esterase n=1 Tax=Cephalotrichum gorgonifer TaxID=2041049 RepID=A0AAE8T036_9PEZI|nr:related to acetylxylan esterase [Cephalotrichum gorgonifer]